MHYDYAREKLWQAVDALVGDGSMQERLATAAIILTRLQRSDEDLPEELREEFKAVYYALTKETDTSNKVNIRAVTQKLTSEEGGQLARRIFRLYVRLRGST